MFAPWKILGQAASQFADEARRNRLVLQEMPMLRDLLQHTKSFRWKSEYFDKTRPVAPARGEEIVDWVFYDREVRRELKRQIERLGGVSGTAFWDLYLRRTWNGVMGFSDGYLSLLQLASSVLPKEGNITNWNCGSGNLASALLLASPQRVVFGIESNPRAAVASKRLLRFCFPAGGNYVVKTGDPLDPEFKAPVSDAAVLESSLFLLESHGAKLETLQQYGKALRPGATVLLIEPKAHLEKQSQLRLWLQRIIKSALLQGSPVTEFELALFVEMQRRLYASGVTTISSTTKLVGLAKEAGYEVQLVRDVFYGHYVALVLKKGEAPKKSVREPIIRYHDDPLD